MASVPLHQTGSKVSRSIWQFARGYTSSCLANSYPAPQRHAPVPSPKPVDNKPAQVIAANSNEGLTWLTVDDFAAVKAHDFNRIQQLSTSSPQQVQQQAVGGHRFRQVSISAGTWFGTRGSEVQILSPRPILSTTFKYPRSALWEWQRFSGFRKPHKHFSICVLA